MVKLKVYSNPIELFNTVIHSFFTGVVEFFNKKTSMGGRRQEMMKDCVHHRRLTAPSHETGNNLWTEKK